METTIKDFFYDNKNTGERKRRNVIVLKERDFASQKIMQSIPDNINTKEGALTNIPYPDNSFDITYACESLEHAIDIKSSVMRIIYLLMEVV